MTNISKLHHIVQLLDDWAEDCSSHDLDCPYMGNHDGALTWYDACGCHFIEELREAADALDALVSEVAHGN